MSQSQKPGRSKGKSKADSFVWTDDEVELLLKVTIEYKVSKTSENVNWESYQTKNSNILDLFVALGMLDPIP